MRPSDLITEAAQFVADYDPELPFVRWTEENWFNAFRYALSMVSLLKPDEFTTQVTIPLMPGSRQSLPPACDRVLSPVDPIRKTSRRAANMLAGRPSCVETFSGDYKVSSYHYDTSDKDALYVDPPVPAGANATLTITCTTVPWPKSVDEDVSANQRLHAPILDIMLWYAFGFDTESVPSRDRAQAHLKAAADALGVAETRLREAAKDRSNP